MGRITLHDKTFRTYIPYKDIEKEITRVAGALNEDLKEEDNPVFIGILNGSYMFIADLMKKINLDCVVTFVKLASYSGTRNTGKIVEVLGLCHDITDKTVVIVEDVVDSGSTIAKLKEDLMKRNPKKILVCYLLFKPNAYRQAAPIEYVCFSIPNDFVVGYGLDYDHLGRNLKDIYVID